MHGKMNLLWPLQLTLGFPTACTAGPDCLPSLLHLCLHLLPVPPCEDEPLVASRTSHQLLAFQWPASCVWIACLPPRLCLHLLLEQGINSPVLHGLRLLPDTVVPQMLATPFWPHLAICWPHPPPSQGLIFGVGLILGACLKIRLGLIFGETE